MACESGIGKIESQTRLLKLIAQLSCEIADAGGGGGGTPGGAPGDLQFNDAGAFGGFGDYNSGTGLLTLTGNLTVPLVTGNLTGNVTGSSSLNVLKAGDTMTGLLTIAQATANTSALAVTGYSLTGANAQSLMSLAGTWNTSGAPTAIDLNITNTGSNAASLLLDLRTGGTSRFSVRVDGRATATSMIVPTIISTGVLTLAATSSIALDAGGSTRWGITVVGTLTAITDNAVDIGAVGATRPRIGYFGTRVDAPTLRTDQAFTVATLPAAGVAGRRAYVTNALAPAYGAAVAGGGAVVQPVFDTGAAWVVG